MINKILIYDIIDGVKFIKCADPQTLRFLLVLPLEMQRHKFGFVGMIGIVQK